MKVLIVGGGGREHALAWRLRQDDPTIELVAAPGNPGIAGLATCFDVAATDIDGLLACARREDVTFTLVGPEAPLAAGIVDRFRDEGLAIFGPTRGAAMIESSKAFSKTLMHEAGIPTADSVICTSMAEAAAAVERFGERVVIKASGLAAGKGVIVCETRSESGAAITSMLERDTFGDAGRTVLVEEFMEGEELSLFAVTDGERAIPLLPAQDHKRLLDEDRGPNTGGMGAYAPAVRGDGPTDALQLVMDRIVEPTLRAMRDRGVPFTGLLYAGVMLTADGPKVVEFNCRFGDPETEAVLPAMRCDPSLLELIRRVAAGEPLPNQCTVTASAHAVTTVLAAAGYPERTRTGDRIVLPPVPDQVLVFHAGTKRASDGDLVTAGGRVLAITGLGDSFDEAQRRSVDYASRVEFDGKQFRTDIGWRELARLSLPRGA
jgi:phosphoribosylamine--glycine ligase